MVKNVFLIFCVKNVKHPTKVCVNCFCLRSKLDSPDGVIASLKFQKQCIRQGYMAFKWSKTEENNVLPNMGLDLPSRKINDILPKANRKK